jgi:hypothetical protein
VLGRVVNLRWSLQIAVRQPSYPKMVSGDVLGDHLNVSTVDRQSGKMVGVGDKFPDANLHDQFPPDFKVRIV